MNKMSVKKSLNVEVEPSVLSWAIKSSGWSEEGILKRLHVNKHIFNSWLKCEKKPTLKQLEDLSSAIKRPLAVFFLSEPPKEKPLPKDYRMLPEKEGEFDKKTILAIRRARRLQRISKELSENIHEDIKTAIIHTTELSDEPKEVAERYRDLFNIGETQKKWVTSYNAFNALRDLIEDKNILVFQIPMPVEDARGFTLVDDSPAIIVVNSKDQIEARLFTLLHEFGHVILGESGISMSEYGLFLEKIDKVEKWCNDFASAFLLPEFIAKNEFSLNKEEITETKTLNRLSRRLKVSKAMLLYNMLKLNFISLAQYKSVLDRYKPELKSKKKGGKKGFAAQTADKRCLSEKGQKFVALVMSNVEKGYITHSDALNYLSIKSKNLEKITSKVRK